MIRYPIPLFMITLLFAQQPIRDQIRNNAEYYYGSGISFDAAEARDKALEELTEQIAVKIESAFSQKLQQKGQQVTKTTEKILHTHSAATLRNVQTIQTPRAGGQIEVFCYLHKNEVEKIFNERRQLIADIARKAAIYATEYNYAYALKLYYFCTLLMNSLPDQSVVCEGHNFSIEVPDAINRLIHEVTFEFLEERRISDQEREITLAVTANRQPVALLDFTFWDGSNQVSVQVRDGLATILLLGASVGFETLKVNVKYAYYECRTEFNVITDLWSLVNHPTFINNKDVELKKKRTLGDSKSGKPVTVSSEYNLKLDFRQPDTPQEAIVNNTLKLINTIQSGKVKDAFTDDQILKTKLTDYLKYNRARPIDRDIAAVVNKTENGWELRRIRMLHEYPSINKQSTEYLVIDFDPDGRIQDINIAVNEFLYKKFVLESQHGDDWYNRLEIVKFLEKYRTAYMTRNIQTVDMMFAEDALIIVGRKIEKKKLPQDMVQYQQMANEPNYEYLTFKKDEYIQRQRQIFQLQHDILLDFASFNIIRKNNAPSVYGVEMRQNYTSSTYADEGYLFLLIDFEGIDPLIYVRAWQPHTWAENQLIKTANFKINK